MCGSGILLLCRGNHSIAEKVLCLPIFWGHPKIRSTFPFPPILFVKECVMIQLVKCPPQCTATIYIGELWRYLLLQPESLDDTIHPLRVIIGNGLNKEIWERVVERFGIQLVVEHYGSTEMPGDAVLNFLNKPGSCGYVPWSVWKEREAKIIRFNVEEEVVIRNKVSFVLSPFLALFFLFLDSFVT